MKRTQESPSEADEDFQDNLLMSLNHQNCARLISSPKRGDMRQKKKMARICVKFRLPFLSESSRKLFGREPLETQLLNPMALFLNLLAHFSRTSACFS